MAWAPVIRCGLEAGLPLYGHELGLDPEDKEIPIFACDLARFGCQFFTA